MDFELDIRGDGDDRKLYFRHIFLSDIHLLTSQCKAKGLSALFEHTHLDNVTLVGDILDLWHASAKTKWDMPKWQRQLIGHILRTTAQTTSITGNHDELLRGSFLASTDLTKLERKALESRIRSSLNPFDKTLPISVKYSDTQRPPPQTDSQRFNTITGNLKTHRRLTGKSIYGIEIKNHDNYICKDGKNILICHGDGFDANLRKKHSGWYKIGDNIIEGADT